MLSGSIGSYVVKIRPCEYRVIIHSNYQHRQIDTAMTYVIANTFGTVGAKISGLHKNMLRPNIFISKNIIT